MSSVVIPDDDDDGDDVVEAGVHAAVGAGGAAEATIMVAPTIAESGMKTEAVIFSPQICFHPNKKWRAFHFKAPHNAV